MSWDKCREAGASRQRWTVSIEWCVQGNELRLESVESHGPAVQPPKTEGFGWLLIRHTAERKLQGTALLYTPQTGVQCSILLRLLRDEVSQAA